MKFSHNGEMLRIEETRDKTGTLSIRLVVDATGEQFTRLSTIITGQPLTGKFFWLRDWSENQEIAADLLKFKIIRIAYDIPPVSSGHVEVKAAEFIYSSL